MKTTLETTADPSAQELAFLGEQLTAFNDADVGASGRKALAVFVRDEAGKVVAGISGYTAWGWLFVQWLWVDESLRGQHMAGQMLQAAEQEAVARGCHGAWIDTFNPKAARAYERQGYQRFGTLPDFPIGRSRIFLQKSLTAA
ncbi:GNAT family N-acetyltransferase [Mesorhizobium sp. M4B.F.Ca.ET.215.01.1.1]|uniref:GNAT family N-acetyltransferase n=2 Tax=Mesorhizobium TaxID=68287 RepID=UPI000FCC9332|nr:MULTISPECIES: GNAT family N-acetyltransferase [unclassified Mesorhizobium]RUW26061.1 GNAT family N-acetyltransferase [Mesorhizobium sp. M4B.F.Ca.ET.013.02.1.1]RUW71246.1 GNAT family N-acetyltransferase [Mesorhizobium sp. M4B.F.Ca.ET.049.02.1.2]RVD45323.1 GNAT family N-acetyltransferase [Mesorhizobium sp. M4B.F.Ca.ET.019.03.1.1]RWF66605.1 MAG: GNAT family N-acetyltransferase [Mesorhizobium sp.]TGQ18624.1 GNAT family N-acetyltransferase [Mesorhizobium sp. M4B.F.Ca.ET.215.01.1.1]